MPLTLKANTQHITKNVPTVVSASGGVEPYSYSVVSGGVGGSIDPASGKYTAPSSLGIDTIRVTDADSATAELQMNILSPLGLLAQIIQTELGLENGRVWFFNQKIDEPKDQNLYVVLRVMSVKPFSNNLKYRENSGIDGVQTANFRSTVSIDIKSRGTEALERKEEVVMALRSQYSLQQQELNALKISAVPGEIPNIGEIDGSAIPYRFNLTINLLYSVTKTRAVDYYDTFENVNVVTDA